MSFLLLTAYKASQAIFNYLGSFVQEHLYDTNSYEKNDKNQCPVMENEHEINEGNQQIE